MAWSIMSESLKSSWEKTRNGMMNGLHIFPVDLVVIANCRIPLREVYIATQDTDSPGYPFVKDQFHGVVDNC